MGQKAVILRRWVSRVRTRDRAEYVRYTEGTGVSDYLQTPGNLGCEMLLRDLGDGSSEVTTLSWWESMDAIRAFAGEEVGSCAILSGGRAVFAGEARAG